MHTILIVDDDEPVRKMLCHMLKQDDYKLLTAENGEQAQSIIDSNNIDLIITDIVMPKIHGLDLIMLLHKVRPTLPVIAISGGSGITGRFDYLEIARIVGANNILRKPFTADTLRTVVLSNLN